MSVYEFRAKTINGTDISLSEYQGKVLLIVNVASQCGFTPQYKGLEKLYEQYKEKGLVVLGFPCNQFAGQEPGNESDIKIFCELNFGVTFPLFSKINVNGPDAHPLYQYLKSWLPGVLGSEGIKWNFTKFLVDRKGEPVKRYASTDTPESMEKDIQEILIKSV
jgi:glutathione peroxidase